MRQIGALVAMTALIASCTASRSDDSTGRRGRVLPASAAPGAAINPGRDPAGAPGAPGVLGIPGGGAGGAGDPGDPVARSQASTFPGRAELDRRVARYLRTRPGRAGLMIVDLSTGIAYGYRPRSRFVAASVSKVNILVGLLLRRQQQHRRLNRVERVLAGRMIRVSDNVAADELYKRAGRRRGLDRINEQFGLRCTRLAPKAWGASLTCPADQVRLLQALATASSPLSEANRQFVLRLMENVSPRQMWGISAVARAGETVALKNGWTPLRYQGTGWAVHSIGRVNGDGHDLLIAAFTTGSGRQGTGIRTAERISRLAVSVLRRPRSAEPGLP
jgi:hypothetical protein